MDIILWVGLGLIVGGVVSLLYDDSFIETIRNILFGFVGSIIGGGIMTFWDSDKLTTNEFYLYSIVFTLLVSIAFIFIARSQKKIVNGLEFLNQGDKLIEDEAIEEQKLTTTNTSNNQITT